ncbi:hypothetical protein K3495_g5784 [Podosphaera aphanis]|nr:hypothetical protein K3495_g5784 [Podosphaera aphanis]
MSLLRFILTIGYLLADLLKIIFKVNDASASSAITIRALLTRSNNPLTIVDSGASKHFSGVKTDFTSLKRWNEPKTVQIANGNIVQCEGYGTISFTTNGKKVDLKEIWFVPDFGNMRLLSVWAFNRRGIDVIFSKYLCRIKRGNQVLFEAHGEDGVYKVPTKSIPSAMPVTELNTTPKPKPETELDILYRRLGHINYKDVDKLLISGCTGLSSNNKQPASIGAKSLQYFEGYTAIFLESSQRQLEVFGTTFLWLTMRQECAGSGC